MDKEDIMTRDEVCKKLDISYATLLNYEKQGLVKKHKFGRKNYYLKSEIIKSVSEN